MSFIGSTEDVVAPVPFPCQRTWVNPIPTSGAALALAAGLVPGTSLLRPWPGGKELLKTLLAQEQIGYQEIEAGKEKAARSRPGEQQRRLEGLS